MKSIRSSVLLIALVVAYPIFSWAKSSAPTPTEDEVSSLELEKQKLEVEKLHLENERLKLELEKAQFQVTKTTVVSEDTHKNDKFTVAVFQSEYSKKVEAIAKENTEKENVLVADFVNSEIWNKGVRYNIHDLYTLAHDRGWKMEKRLDERAIDGDPRYLYRFRNMSLMKYESRKRGILTLTPSVQDDDFQVLAPENVSFSSNLGDVRNAYQSAYFNYDGQDKDGKLQVLKYKHNQELNFADWLKFWFDPNEKIVKIQYGVLEER